MRIVYEAADGIEGHMMVDYLKMHGITAFIQGEYLQGGAGGLPVAGLVKIQVNDVDWVEARAVIDAWSAAQPNPDQTPRPETPGAKAKYLTAFISGLVLGATLTNCQPEAASPLGHGAGHDDDHARAARPADHTRHARSAARMMLAMQLLQPFARDVGIDLRGGNVGMPQQHLHHAQIGAVVEQMGGKSVAQHVR